MKKNYSKGIWPAELEQYKEIIDANPNYSSYTEEEKILLADRIMNSTYADLMNNWAFQWVFLNNPEPLIMLLADILEEDIVSISYLPNQGVGWPADSLYSFSSPSESQIRWTVLLTWISPVATSKSFHCMAQTSPMRRPLYRQIRMPRFRNEKLSLR